MYARCNPIYFSSETLTLLDFANTHNHTCLSPDSDFHFRLAHTDVDITHTPTHSYAYHTPTSQNLDSQPRVGLQFTPCSFTHTLARPISHALTQTPQNTIGQVWQRWGVHCKYANSHTITYIYIAVQLHLHSKRSLLVYTFIALLQTHAGQTQKKWLHQPASIQAAACTHGHTHLDMLRSSIDPKRVRVYIKAGEAVQAGCVADQCFHRSERVH